MIKNIVDFEDNYKNYHNEHTTNIIYNNDDCGFTIFKYNEQNSKLIKVHSYEQKYKMSMIKIIDNANCIFVSDNDYFVKTKQKHKQKKIADEAILTSTSTTTSTTITAQINAIVFINYQNNKIHEHFSIPYEILNLIVIQKYIFVITKNKIFIYSYDTISNDKNLDNITFIKTINTYDNNYGLCSVKCYNKDNLTIATLGRNIGEVLICNLDKKSNIYIQAHQHALTNIELDNNNKYIATTSESGTLINVFKMSDKTKEYQFRRGIFNANIYNVAFDNKSQYLSCCSNNGTVHIFNLYSTGSDIKNTTSNFSILVPIVPICGSEWAYKLYRINSNTKSLCKFVHKINNGVSLHILAQDLNYYVINDIETNNSDKNIIKNEIINN